jgi:trigger factor
MAEHSTAPVTEVRVEVQEPTSWSRRLSITVPSERVRRIRESVATKLANSVRMPGFRKGKTPASLVERQFGPHIEQETMDRVIQDAYREALDAQDFKPITQGQVEHVHYHGQGGDLHFEVEFEVQPVLNLARIDGFQVVRPADAIGDDEVDSLLERLRTERATLHSLDEEQKPDYGDQVLVEITNLDEAGEEGAVLPLRLRERLRLVADGVGVDAHAAQQLRVVVAVLGNVAQVEDPRHLATAAGGSVRVWRSQPRRQTTSG